MGPNQALREIQKKIKVGAGLLEYQGSADFKAAVLEETLHQISEIIGKTSPQIPTTTDKKTSKILKNSIANDS